MRSSHWLQHERPERAGFRMRDIFTHLKDWASKGQRIALATVVKTWGSSPRAVGSKMVVNERGEMAGSVSGGCVEGAVVREALALFQEDRPKLLHYGVTDGTAWDVGLACGGEIDILLQRFPAPQETWGAVLISEIEQALSQRQCLSLAMLFEGPQACLGLRQILRSSGERHSTLPDVLQLKLDPHMRAAMDASNPGMVRFEFEGQPLKAFIDVYVPDTTLVIIGAVHIAVILAALAKRIGYRVVIIDPRSAFATRARFPEADEILRVWPVEGLEKVSINQTTAIAILSHDPKLDDPALGAALPSKAFYVGALGSQKTQAARRVRLLEMGVESAALDRLRGPIGLDLGGRHPAEISLGILAEIVAVRHAASQI